MKMDATLNDEVDETESGIRGTVDEDGGTKSIPLPWNQTTRTLLNATTMCLQVLGFHPWLAQHDKPPVRN